MEVVNIINIGVKDIFLVSLVVMGAFEKFLVPSVCAKNYLLSCIFVYYFHQFYENFIYMISLICMVKKKRARRSRAIM